MSHSREQIRAAVETAVTGLTTTGSRVFASRVYPLNDNELPCLLVHTRLETSTPITMGPRRRMERTVTVMVEGVVKANQDYDDTLDTISVEVEQAIYNAPSLQGLVKDIFLSGTEIKFTGESDKPVAVISMSFMARYNAREDQPETIS